MTGRGITLQDFLQELTYAAGPGGAHISSTVEAAGNVQAKTGLRIPGPALRQARQRRGRTADAVASERVPRVADRMAKVALDEGAALLNGKKRKS